MQVVYIHTGISIPFAFIDLSVVKAMKELDLEVFVLGPGAGLESEWNAIQENHSPQLVITMLGEYLTSENLQFIKSLPIPKAIWYTDDPYAIDRALSSCDVFDYVFTNESKAIEVYKNKGCTNVFHLPLAAPYPAFSPLSEIRDEYRSDVVMVGTGFNNRLVLINQLENPLKMVRTSLVGFFWPPQIASYVRGEWVTPEEAREYYNGSKIVLNIHRSYDDPYLRQNTMGIRANTPNNRTFEVAACSVFQLMDYRPDIALLYDTKEEMVVCDSVEDWKEKIIFYLEHEELRKKIAQNAYKRTLREHLYKHRIYEIICKIFPKESASFSKYIFSHQMVE